VVPLREETEDLSLGIDRHTGDFPEIEVGRKFQKVRNRAQRDLADRRLSTEEGCGQQKEHNKLRVVSWKPPMRLDLYLELCDSLYDDYLVDHAITREEKLTTSCIPSMRWQQDSFGGLPMASVTVLCGSIGDQ
jgi:hypothetical protein